VAILPFEDRTGHDEEGLGKRLSDQFASRLALGSLAVIDRAQVEAAFAEAGVEIPERLTAEDRRAIREVTGCEAVVTGLLAEYEEGSLWNPPKVALAVRFVDLAGGGTLYRDGGVSPPPAGGALFQDAERLALGFAGDLADRMNHRIHAEGGALSWR